MTGSFFCTQPCASPTFAFAASSRASLSARRCFVLSRSSCASTSYRGSFFMSARSQLSMVVATYVARLERRTEGIRGMFAPDNLPMLARDRLSVLRKKNVTSTIDPRVTSTQTNPTGPARIPSRCDLNVTRLRSRSYRADESAVVSLAPPVTSIATNAFTRLLVAPCAFRPVYNSEGESHTRGTLKVHATS